MDSGKSEIFNGVNGAKSPAAECTAAAFVPGQDNLSSAFPAGSMADDIMGAFNLGFKACKPGGPI